jgi:DNA segregation ATPase FtsK/SpoIIIE, S-DNA-T family
MACMDITFERIARNQGQALVHVGRRDSLAETFPWPWLDRETTNFLGPIPAGVDRNGKPVTIDLRGRHALVGGMSGGGKSVFLHSLIAAAMGDVRVKTHLLDGKMGIELDAWEKSATSFATDDEPELAMKILKRLEARVNKIFAEFRSVSERKPDWSKVQEVNLLVVDEFTAFLSIPGFQRTLNELLRRGRAAGLIVVLATQRPSSKVVDTDFRELFHYRIAFWSDKAGSKMILGDGVEADSSEFSGSNPGEMVFLADGRIPTHCRGYELTDNDLAILAARATALRSNRDAPTGSGLNDEQANDPGNGPDTDVSLRSPFGTQDRLTVVPQDLPGEVSGWPVEPRKPLTEGQSATLAAVNAVGEPVTVRDLAVKLGAGERSTARRLAQLEGFGFVAGIRRAHRPGEGEGARDPKLWQLTPDGTTELSDAPFEAREEAAR